MNSEKTTSVFLAFGSNLGDRQDNILTAYNKIEERVGKIVSLSSFYFSEAKGFNSDNQFVNSVCEVCAEIDIYELFSHTQSIEKDMGRLEKSRVGEYTDRIIDIDLILAGNTVIDTPKLIVPHPRMHLRMFVIEPLCEIAPEIIHPILGKTIKQIKNDIIFSLK